MNRLDRVLKAVRAWRKTISPNEFSQSQLKSRDLVPLGAVEQELVAAIDDLDVFTAKPTDPAMSAVAAPDDPPKTDRNS